MTDLPRTQAERVNLLRKAIKASGLSSRRYAETVMIREPRTVRRWLTGESPIPDAVIRWLMKQAQ